MGAFYLTRKTDDSSTGLPGDGDIRRWFEREGFAAPEVCESGGWRVYVYPKIVGGERSLYRAPGGEFCAVTGTLLYRDATGAAAALKLYSDFTDGGIDWGRAFGQYAVLIGDGRTVSLFTDPIGLYPVWHDDDFNAVSSSFLATANAVARLTTDPQCIYEYVFQGTTYGDRTLFREVHLHPCRDLVAFGDTVTRRPLHPPFPRSVRQASLDEHLDIALSNLGRYFDSIAACFGDRVDTALSGGYDSRLALALLRARGLTPSVHVYGSDIDGDVAIARAIATGEGFRLEHVDKSMSPRVAEDRFAEEVGRNLLSFQGNPSDGIFDNATDLATRRKRCSGGYVALNGGGGEIFRNFFYLPDRTFPIRELLWTFYSAFDPSWCTDAFDENVYMANLGRKVKQTLGTDSDRLSRTDVEAVYPLFRCRYWMGKNNSVNNRLGPALTPFIDANIVPDALALPMRYKNSGLFEGRLIRRAMPSLAVYESDYGHSFAVDPPLRRRIGDWTVRARPPRLRRLGDGAVMNTEIDPGGHFVWSLPAGAYRIDRINYRDPWSGNYFVSPGVTFRAPENGRTYYVGTLRVEARTERGFLGTMGGAARFTVENRLAEEQAYLRGKLGTDIASVETALMG